MAYEKQNFQDGQVLTAEQLNKMEEYFGNMSYNDLKDKVFGTEAVTILPETELTFAPNADMGGLNIAMFEFVSNPKGGNTCIVTFNGTDYECVASENPDSIMIGNMLFGGGDDTGEPFFLISSGGMTIAFAGSDITSATMSVKELQVVTLDAEYLPEIEIDLVALGLPTVSEGLGVQYELENVDFALYKTLQLAMKKGTVQLRAKITTTYIDLHSVNGTQTATEQEVIATANISNVSVNGTGIEFVATALLWDNLFVVEFHETGGSFNIGAKLIRLAQVTA